MSYKLKTAYPSLQTRGRGDAVTQTAYSLDGGITFTGNGNYSLIMLSGEIQSTGLYPTFTSRDDGLNYINSLSGQNASGQGGEYQGAGIVNNISFLIDGTTTLTTNFLVNEYKRGSDVVDIMKGVKTVSKIGKVSTALNVGAVGYDIVTGNVQSSTVADAAMIVGGVIIGVAIGPITAGVVGIVYGGAMIMGGQDAINNAFNGNWNLQLNKSINNIYGK